MPLLHCLITFCLAWILGGILPILGRKLKLVSRPNPRRLEKEGKPLIGGIAIFLSVCTTAAYFGFPQTKMLLALSFPLLLIGIIDDRRELRARHKLPVQTLVSAAWLLSYSPHEWLLVHLGLDPIISFCLTLFWMVGIINAVNLVDGIDGVAAGLSFITLTLLAFFLHLPQPLFFGVAASATLGVLLRNWYPAKIYLGDAGSSLLGFWMAAGYAVLKLPATLEIHILIPLLILAYPEFDTVFAICRRLSEGRSPFTGDRRHIHHMLKDLGLSIRGVATTIITITTILAFAAYSLGTEDDHFTRILAGHTICALIGLFILVSKLHKSWNRRTQELGVHMIGLEYKKKNFTPVTSAKIGLKVPIRPFFSHFHDPNLTRVEFFCSDLLKTLANSVPQSSIVLHNDTLYVISDSLLDSGAVRNATWEILECLDRNYVERWAIREVVTVDQNVLKDVLSNNASKYPRTLDWTG